MGPHPAVAAIRLAVRRALREVLADAGSEPGTGLGGPSTGHVGNAALNEPGTRRPGQRRAVPDRPPLVLAACSGGADSMALASALAFEASRSGVRAGGVTVDHGLQEGSAGRAEEVSARLRELGLDPVECVRVRVGGDGGPEAAARTARYAALDEVAGRLGASAVLLGHTRDDQAETVLLGLARGSGTRSLSGMAACTGSIVAVPGSGAAGPAAAHAPAAEALRRYRRPFLGIDRQTTRTSCMEQALPVWDDPHNSDPAYTRSRVRHEALPVLEKALGKGVVEALARTAQLARDDADALDAWAAEAERSARVPEQGGPPAGARPRIGLDIGRLAVLPPAVRRRVLRRAAVEAGAPAGSLYARHIEEADRLITAWRGQRAINLPGRVEAGRTGGTLFLRQSDV
ncbi:tRNA lysidine(34) synthetase TilS [Streptomyces sp. XM4193]|uniref:tRNA lysidine(34) synthetase TilS n=1 Tax=Streptomyces sp. XM4193 TaxID=2929782 RepID=UPI001FF949F0|nr:tRNA lysidine(34) synthetase TilS [Streptomyces sp. XM4193]MCK1798312.1 tRNA lysidine(34) synthetase TilS [Streptomyces sp. XM4193]